MKNFKDLEYDDYDRLIKVRGLDGRITQKRIDIINSFIERFNDENAYPYGKGYSCGHVHDCCGCLVRKYMDIEISKNKIKIYWIETYNY